jgi:hypothetical protein
MKARAALGLWLICLAVLASTQVRSTGTPTEVIKLCSSYHPLRIGYQRSVFLRAFLHILAVILGGQSWHGTAVLMRGSQPNADEPQAQP